MSTLVMEEENKQEQNNIFPCELTNWPIKDDMASMEFPLFSLTKQKDTKVREFRRGNKIVRIIPSSVGAATVFDKDLLLYIASHIVEACNKGFSVSRTVKINSIDFLNATERGDGNASFERIINMLRRLRGTTIETNIPTGTNNITQTNGFSMLDSFQILSSKTYTTKSTVIKKKLSSQEQIEVEKIFSFTVTISEWLYNALLNFEVLTIEHEYFKLKRSIDRRLYEIARKHCGEQAIWKINIDLLAEKLGSSRERFKIRDEIRQTIKTDLIPQYHIALDTSPSIDEIVFYTRVSSKISLDLIKNNKIKWFDGLERHDNIHKWCSKKK